MEKEARDGPSFKKWSQFKAMLHYIHKIYPENDGYAKKRTRANS